MNKSIPLSAPNLKGIELEYVTYAVETEWVSTGGPYVNDFEMKIAEYARCKGVFLVKMVHQDCTSLLKFVGLQKMMKLSFQR